MKNRIVTNNVKIQVSNKQSNKVGILFLVSYIGQACLVEHIYKICNIYVKIHCHNEIFVDLHTQRSYILFIMK